MRLYAACTIQARLDSILEGDEEDVYRVRRWAGSSGTFLRLDVELSNHSYQNSDLLDVRRISDGKLVMLKKISTETHPHEAEIGRMLSTPQMLADPRNHCIPLYDVLQVPGDEDIQLLVMPFLRGWNDPPLDTVGETVEFLRQMLEVIRSFEHIYSYTHVHMSGPQIYS